MRGTHWSTGAAITMLALTAACGGGDAANTDSLAGASASAAAGGTTAAAPAPAAPGGVTVSMISAAGTELGTLTLTESGGMISVSGTLRGLPPGDHGIHLHSVGQCTPPFESAGPHWNPASKMHGTENPQGPHAGDMPNITVGADSTANVNVTSAGGPLRGASALIDTDGAAVLIHEKGDDYKTDPSGNSGARIACGAVASGS